MAQLFVDILILLVAARALGEVFERFRQSAMLGEILAGILLGRALLGFIGTSPVEMDELGVVADLGAFILVFLAGLEMNTGDVSRAIRRGGMKVGVLGFALPFTLGYGLGVAVALPADTALVLGLCLAVTALPVSVRILLDLGLTEHRVGRMIVSAAILNDVLALTLLGIIIGVRGAGGTDLSTALYIAGFTVLKTAVLIATVVTFARALQIKQGVTSATPRALRQLLAAFRGRESLFALSILFVLAFASVSELLGLHYVVGAFFGGLLLSTRLLGEHNYKHVERTTSALSYGFLAPIFFGFIGLRFTPDAIINNPTFSAVVVVVAVVGKLVAGYIGGRWMAYPAAESMALGLGLNGRGMIEIVIASLALQMGLISADLFSILVLMTMATTLMTPPLLKAAIGRAAHEPGAETGRVRAAAVAPSNGAPAGPNAGWLAAPIVIVGGGRVAREIAVAVGPCTVLEKDADQARMLAAFLAEVNIVIGEAGREDDLRRAGVTAGCIVLAVTDSDEANEFVVRFAKAAGARRVIARTDQPSEVERLRAIGADAVLNTSYETASAILLELYPPDASMSEIFLHRGSPAIGGPLAKFELPRGTVVRSISRKGKVLVPTAETVMEARDTVILSGSPPGLVRAREILAGPHAGAQTLHVLAFTPNADGGSAIVANEIAPLAARSGGGLVVAVPWGGAEDPFAARLEEKLRARKVAATVVKGYSLSPPDLREALRAARGPGVVTDGPAAGESGADLPGATWIVALPKDAIGKGPDMIGARRLLGLPTILAVPVMVARRGSIPHTILALIDGAEGADRAGTLACEIALLTGARLTLLVARFEDDAEPRDQAAFITAYARSIGLGHIEEAMLEDPNPAAVERRMKGKADLFVAASVPRALRGRDLAVIAGSGDCSVLLV